MLYRDRVSINIRVHYRLDSFSMMPEWVHSDITDLFCSISVNPFEIITHLFRSNVLYLWRIFYRAILYNFSNKHNAISLLSKNIVVNTQNRCTTLFRNRTKLFEYWFSTHYHSISTVSNYLSLSFSSHSTTLATFYS